MILKMVSGILKNEKIIVFIDLNLWLARTHNCTEGAEPGSTVQRKANANGPGTSELKRCLISILVIDG